MKAFNTLSAHFLFFIKYPLSTLFRLMKESSMQPCNQDTFSSQTFSSQTFSVFSSFLSAGVVLSIFISPEQSKAIFAHTGPINSYKTEDDRIIVRITTCMILSDRNHCACRCCRRCNCP